MVRDLVYLVADGFLQHHFATQKSLAILATIANPRRSTARKSHHWDHLANIEDRPRSEHLLRLKMPIRK